MCKIRPQESSVSWPKETSYESSPDTLLPLLWLPLSLFPTSAASRERDLHDQKGWKSRRCGMTSVPNRRIERIRSSSARSPKLNSPKKVLNMPDVAHTL